MSRIPVLGATTPHGRTRPIDPSRQGQRDRQAGRRHELRGGARRCLRKGEARRETYRRPRRGVLSTSLSGYLSERPKVARLRVLILSCMADRWSAYVRLHDRALNRSLVHRVDPDHAGLTLCGLAIKASPVLAKRPKSISPCGSCGALAGRARKREQDLADMGARTGGATRSKKALRRAAVLARRAELDRQDRARERGSSIRTVSGGLPTLGRRR
jgi:hypothetical protein